MPNALARKLGLFDAAMLVMGGIVGAGIFINPHVVAQQVHTPALILGAWLGGGIIALLGAFVYAELAARLPRVGGQYAYLREAFHPALGFLYGWVLLLVIQTGGMAAVAITFARYTLELVPMPLPDWSLAVMALALLTLINCLGVRMGSSMQSALMVTKIVAIAALVAAGWIFVDRSEFHWSPISRAPLSAELLSQFGAALVPVLFSYGGWQTASFVAEEMRQPERDLPRGLLIGVLGVIALYTGVSFICLRVLGPDALAATSTPASAVMRAALGHNGGRLIAIGIAISALGFLSQSILTAPRVYFAMAEDGLFFRAVARVNARTRVPLAAIVLQSAWTIVIALTGSYEKILNYVVAMDFLFFGLSASCLFVFRAREQSLHTAGQSRPGAVCSGYRVPGHPVTTAAFVVASWLVVANTIYRYPENTLVGMAILAAGVPVYWYWQRRQRAIPVPATGESEASHHD